MAVSEGDETALWITMMVKGRTMRIYTVSPQECGRELRRRPEHYTNIASSHRDPLHVSETVLSCNAQWKFNVDVSANIPSSVPSVPLRSTRGVLSLVFSEVK